MVKGKRKNPDAASINLTFDSIVDILKESDTTLPRAKYGKHIIPYWSNGLSILSQMKSKFVIHGKRAVYRET